VLEYVVFGIPEKKRLRIGALRADYAPLPSRAEVITRVLHCDLKMMLHWTRSHAKRGWNVHQLRTACEYDGGEELFSLDNYASRK
jgi:hypothetical protein